MGILKEFREFAMKGNIVDLAVAVVLGTAFGKVVTGLTESFIMPVISLIIGKGGVGDLTTTIAGTAFPYGKFLQATIDFILIAFVLFLMIRTMNKLMRKKEAAPPPPAPPSEEVLLLREIRNSLKK
jgi:large conductance mechanosensitive channel